MNTAVAYVAEPEVTLTDDQQAAFDAFMNFLLDPHDDVFVLAGYSGTGKTTLVRTLLERLPKIEAMARLVEADFGGWEIELTATTNKAAEAFSQITGQTVNTIHSLLGLRVHTDYKTRETSLQAKNGGQMQHRKLIFIDEGSFADRKLLRFVNALTKDCKIVFIGDPAQLTPIESADVPVFTSGYKGAQLTQVVRQAAGNPIIAVATDLRNWVETGEVCQITLDHHRLQWMNRQAFNDAMRDEFTDPTWKFNRSKFLAWTNKCCINTNHLVNSWVKGQPDFQVGDYAINNRFIGGKTALKTDQLVLITDKQPDTHFGYPGFTYQVDKIRDVFVPDDPVDRDRAIKDAKAREDFHTLQTIDDIWADLRSVYACTVNKAQGSTYNRVFIDLDDIGKCRNTNQIARMLYVAVTRASETVIFTGDL